MVKRNVPTPYFRPDGQADRKESRWKCGKRIAEEANADSVMGTDRGSRFAPPERGQNSAGCLITREFIGFLKGVRQMNGKTCATSDAAKAWDSIDWNKAEAYVKNCKCVS